MDNNFRPAKEIFISLCVFIVMCFSSATAPAIPSFVNQTGVSCGVCHTVFPELTPFGRSFKRGGYVMSKSNTEYISHFSAMLELSYTEQRGLQNRIDPFDDQPDAKFNLPQEASLFYGGKLIGNLGAFIQLTYDGIGNALFLDNTDIRYTYDTKIAGKNMSMGLSLNNNPGVQDVWNTIPAWSFPGAASDVALTPAASALIEGGLAQQVGGIGAHFFFANLIYGEIAVYLSNDRGITRPLGAGTPQDVIADGVVPYWRLALQQQWGNSSFSIGTFGIMADIYPEGMSAGVTDRFIDTAFDAQYQFIYAKHAVTANAVWIHEMQYLDGTFALGNSVNSSNHLDTIKANVDYFYRTDYGSIGGAVAYFSTKGGMDPGLYSPAQLTGSRTGNPDSDGFIFELDFVLGEKYKFAVQYTLYNKFNGAHSNYDGFGRNASDNDSLYLLAWLLF